FDVSVHEIFSVCLRGGHLDIAPERVRHDGRTLSAWLRERRIESAYLPPAMLPDLRDAMIQGGFPLKRLLAGGEPIPARLLGEMVGLRPGLEAISGSGPTETTVAITEYAVTTPEALDRWTPLGRPNRNTRIYLLSRGLETVPVGVPGELCAAGAGVTWGY